MTELKSRRELLKDAVIGTAAIAAVPALLRPASATGSAQSDGAEALRVQSGVAPAHTIDWHNHWFSPRAVDILSRRTTAPRLERSGRGPWVFVSGLNGVGPALPLALEFTDIEARIKHLDSVGVQRQVVSWPTTLGADALLSAEEAKPLWSAYNEDLSALVAQHPDRFSGLAALPTSDVAWAASELDRAHTKLGLIGAVLPVGAVQTLEGANKLAPIFEVAQRHGSHIYFHTGPASAAIPGQSRAVTPIDDAHWVRANFDTSASFANGAVTLTQTDFLDPYTNVTVQIAMLGGSSPLIASWLTMYAKNAPGDDPIQRLRRIYFDTGVYGRETPLTEFAANVIGADRILFGSDYPLATIDKTIAPIQGSNLSVDDKQKIFVQNGVDLLAAKA